MKHESKEVDYKLLKVSSSTFKDKESIPVKYTCDGVNVSPPLDVDNIPAEAKSLCIIVDDPDAPGKTWVHWIIWNIPVTHHLGENEAHGVQGMNDFNKKIYGGPCPPGGTHRYFFKVYALDCTIDLPVTSTKHNLENAIGGHILAFGELIGLYKRK